MLSLWNWLVGHAGIIGSIIGGGGILAIIGVVLTLRGQRETRRLADERNRLERSLANERNRLELQERRRQICVPLLASVHEFAPFVAEFRKLHDELWARQQLFWSQSKKSYQQRLDAFFATANERAAVAGSELSIDPAGQKAKDAFTAYLEAQRDYTQAITRPLRTFPRYFFAKADTSTLDELAKKADEKLTALEEAVRLYVNAFPDTGQPSQNGQPGALSPSRHLVQIVQRWRKSGAGSGQVTS